jgi:hypothetical protein
MELLGLLIFLGVLYFVIQDIGQHTSVDDEEW